MAITFTKLLSDCLIALGDPLAATWSRTNTIWPWAEEAMLAFPILRPMLYDLTNGASKIYYFDLPVDFREVLTVEYPVAQTPTSFLARKNRLDPDFYAEAGYYDIDHDYKSGAGWQCHVSGGVAALAHIYVEYFANHEIGLADDATDEITVPDEYENILIAYVVVKAYRERLSAYMQDPTAHTSMVYQMTEMVRKAEDNYKDLVQRTMQRLADSRITPNISADKFDRVY
jgi:hypothetical protein